MTPSSHPRREATRRTITGERGGTTMSTWTDTLAAALEVHPLNDADAERLLDASRDVSHRVERKQTPLTSYLVGVAVGRAVADGTDPGEALDDALAMLARVLPAAAPGDP
jgi:hypothetical protein